MNILVLGAAGFIGTNLAIKLAENKNDKITLVGRNIAHFSDIQKFNFPNVVIKISSLDNNEDFSCLEEQDVVYHLVSTNVPIPRYFLRCMKVFQLSAWKLNHVDFLCSFLQRFRKSLALAMI